MQKTKKIKIYVIIHGFGGGIYEVKPLYDFLRSKNLNVCSIILAGHGDGKTRKDLSKCSYKDWIQSAVYQVGQIKKQYGGNAELIFIGFSMGGLICAHLSDFFRAEKIVFVNTPVYYWNFAQIFQNIIFDLKQRDFANIKFYRKSIVNSPLKALTNFIILLFKTKSKFSSICVKRAEPLILQCLDDDTVNSRSADFIKNETGAKSKVIYYKTGGHLVFLSKTSGRICKDIYDYLN